MVGNTRQQAAGSLKRAAMRSIPKARGSTLSERPESPANVLKAQAGNSTRLPKSPNALSSGGIKRKERGFEPMGIERTNINVVVRCRGRNEREVKENSGVVVSADGVQGKSVELSMGPNAMGNKAYQFDRVFSPAADQAIVFEDVVVPILNDVRMGSGLFEYIPR